MEMPRHSVSCRIALRPRPAAHLETLRRGILAAKHIRKERELLDLPAHRMDPIRMDAGKRGQLRRIEAVPATSYVEA